MATDPNITRIKFLRSKTANAKPTAASIDEGELAINLTDRTIFSKNGTVVVDLGFGKGGTVDGAINQTTGGFTTIGTVTAPTFIGALNGNANSASKWLNARAITLTGNNVSGTTTIDGTTNVTLPVVVNSVTPTEALLKFDVKAADAKHGLSIDWVNTSSGFPSYGTVLTAKGYAAGGSALQLYVPYGPAYGGDSLRYRHGLYAAGVPWTDLKTIMDDENFNRWVPSKTGDGASGSWNINAASATKLQTPRTINNVPFDGSSNINVQAVSIEIPRASDLNDYLDEGVFYCNSNATVVTLLNCPINLAFSLTVEKTAGVIQTLRQYNSSLSWSRGTAAAGSKNFTKWIQNANVDTPMLSNAATATKLETPRAINGTVFDGTANITIAQPIFSLPLSAFGVSDINSIASDGGVEFRYGSTVAANKAPGTDHAYLSMGYNDKFNSQLAIDWRTATMYTRGKSSGTWGTWSTQLDSKNFNDYAVPLTGGTITGQLNVKGTIISDSDITSSGVIRAEGGYYASDVRKIQPNNTNSRAVTPYFTSIGGLTGPANNIYADFLCLNTYVGASGGKQNGIAFAKGAKRIHHYQADNSSAVGNTSWGTPSTIAYLDDNVASASILETVRTLSITGDATGSTSFDGSANVSTALTLANSGVVAGTYKSVTVDAKGRVTNGKTIVTSLVTATTAAGTGNTATTNANTYLNIVENVGGAVSSVGSSTQITGVGTVTITSDAAGKLTITGAQTVTGNAGSATKLLTGRAIGITGSGASGSVVFDGTANVNIPLVVATQATATNNTTIATTAFVQAVNSADTGSAATAVKLKTARTISLTGNATGSVSFDGSANVSINTVIPKASVSVEGLVKLNNTLTSTSTTEGLTAAQGKALYELSAAANAMVNAKWVDETATHVPAKQYTNTLPYPITVYATFTYGGGSDPVQRIDVSNPDGTIVRSWGNEAHIPVGYKYTLINSGGGGWTSLVKVVILK